MAFMYNRGNNMMGGLRKTVHYLFGKLKKDNQEMKKLPEDNEEKKDSNLINADCPIKGRQDDKLNRSEFAHSVANAIINYSGNSSFCMGLYGAWGSGKTSLLNMIHECVEEVNPDVIIMRFNPWLCSDSKQLISQFFTQLSSAMKLKMSPQHRIYQLLDSYGALFEAFGGPVAIVGKTISSRASENVNERENNLQRRKEEIVEALTKEGTKIVVTIDDIDRLSENEIIAVFQLVRALADFPNTVYILAFDYEVVIKALSKVQNGDGRQYLEKIVQMPIEIPTTNIQNIHNALFSNLDSIIGKVPEGKFDKVAWNNVYLYGISKYIHSMRDVNRYVNVFLLKYGPICSEIDIVDLMAVVCIQVFEPQLYTCLAQNAEEFCGYSYYDGSRWAKNAEEELKEKINLMLNNANINNIDAAKELIGIMFPKVGSILRVFARSTYDNKAYLARNKVASPHAFKRYFSLSLEEHDIPHNVIDRLFTEADQTETYETIKKYNALGEIAQLLEKIDAYIYKKESDLYQDTKLKNIIIGLIKIWPDMINKDDGFITYPIEWKTQDCIANLLWMIDDDTRFSFIKNLFSDMTIQASSLGRLLERFESQHGRFFDDKKEEEKKCVTIDELLELEKLLQKRALQSIEDRTAITQKNGLGFMWILGKIDEEFKKEVIKKIITDDFSIAQVINNCSSSARVASTIVYKTKNVNINTLSQYIDIDEAYQRMKNYAMTNDFMKIDEDVQKSVIAFIVQQENKDNYDSDIGISEERIKKEMQKLFSNR